MANLSVIPAIKSAVFLSFNSLPFVSRFLLRYIESFAVLFNVEPSSEMEYLGYLYSRFARSYLVLFI